MTSETFKVKHENFDFIKPQDRIMILGAAGQGKTVCMFHIAELLHNKNVKVNWLAPRIAFKLKEQGKIPEWINLIPLRYGKFEGGCMTLYDDAALGAYAREFFKRRNIDFNKLLITARHRKSGIIITTQETGDIDNKILPKCNYVIFKKPGRFAVQMERPAVRKISNNVREMFENEIETRSLDSRKYCYVLSDTWEGWVGSIDPPEWFTPEIGDW